MPAQFPDFYNSLATDAAKRRKQFEHFVKWFLKADPEWATQVDQVWLWDEWPGRWGADCGIDLVFCHKNGEHWAVQAKCYSPDHDITKHDVDKFLSESNRPLIQHRLLIATTDCIGAIDQLSEIDTVIAFELRDRAKISRLLSGIPSMATLQSISVEEKLRLKGCSFQHLKKLSKNWHVCMVVSHSGVSMTF